MRHNSAVFAEGLKVTRRGTEILHGLDLDVPAGGITGLFGDPGSGKTTLLRVLTGRQRPSAGTVRVLGLPTGDSRLRTRVGHTSQAPATQSDLTARENVQDAARRVGMSRADAEVAIERVHLGRYADTRVDRLGRAHAVRTAIACALVTSPQLLLMDEPTTGLDDKSRAGLWQLFREIAGGGVTVLVASALPEEAERCDAAIHLLEGRLEDPRSGSDAEPGPASGEAADYSGSAPEPDRLPNDSV
ncbi:ATP-binding cassette domain-containing protein [Micrococcus luteus]